MKEEFKAALNSINVTEESPNFTLLPKVLLNGKTILKRGEDNTYTFTYSNNSTELVEKLTEEVLDELLISHGIVNAEERKFMINALSKGSKQAEVIAEEPNFQKNLFEINENSDMVIPELTLDNINFTVSNGICTKITYIGKCDQTNILNFNFVNTYQFDSSKGVGPTNDRDFEATLNVYGIKQPTEVSEEAKESTKPNETHVWTKRGADITAKDSPSTSMNTDTRETGRFNLSSIMFNPLYMMRSVTTFITQGMASLLSLLPGMNLNKSSSKSNTSTSNIPGGPDETPKDKEKGTGQGTGAG